MSSCHFNAVSLAACISVTAACRYLQSVAQYGACSAGQGPPYMPDHGAEHGAEHGTAEHGTAGHGAADHGAADHGAEHGAVEHGTAEHGAADHGAADHGAAGYGAVDYGAACQTRMLLQICLLTQALGCCPVPEVGCKYVANTGTALSGHGSLFQTDSVFSNHDSPASKLLQAAHSILKGHSHAGESPWPRLCKGDPCLL